MKTEIVRIGAHLIAGLYIGLGAICYTGLIASGDPTQGQNMTLTAVTALVLGGVSLSGGRGGVTGALMGAVSLWLIGYVLATFNFGAIQAFMTQMVYGLILVLSLVLTLLVPFIVRYIGFISPGSAFLVLGLIVVGIMLQVGTRGQFPEVPPVAATAALADRYFLTPPASVAAGMTATQGFALLAGLAALAFAFVARVVSAEAEARRMGLFLYLLVVALLLALVAALAVQPDSALFGGGT